MRFSLADLAAAVDGTIESPLDASAVADVWIDGVSIDSRSTTSGNLFVPLVAERDGHDFIAAALEAGASAYLCSAPLDKLDSAVLEDRHESTQRITAARIRVADTTEALTALGRAARDRIESPVIGITGSVGKTSVKDLTLAACTSAAQQAYASVKSFNNEIGVPLTLANAPTEASAVIVEMGSRGIGHIEYLCSIARPTVGVVTTVALAHSELFGSIEAVAQGKGELIEALGPNGVAVLNADNAHVAAMSGLTSASIVTFGERTQQSSDPGGPDIGVTNVELDSGLRPSFELVAGDKVASVTLEARGAHMAANAAAAVAAATAIGIPFADAARQVTTAALSPWRMAVATAVSGAVIIDDTYNANPTSMRAALQSLNAAQVRIRIAVLGEMGELGEEGEREHLAIAEEAKAAGVRVIAVGARSYGPVAEHVDSIAAAYELIGPLSADSAVLVKGSRSAGLEVLAARLIEDDSN